jgi:AraC-like DNA-binding protein
MTPHGHPRVELTLVADGNAELIAPGRASLHLQAGDVVAIPPGLLHAFSTDDRGCVFQVVMMDDLPQALLRRLMPSALPARFAVSIPGQRAFSDLAGRIAQELACRRELSEELCFALATELAILIMRAGGPGAAKRNGEVSRGYVDAALAAVRAGETRVEQLAAVLHISPSHLRRLFQRDLGLSPRAYLQRRRRQVAEELLRHTDLPVGAIAVQLGYATHRDFTAAFTRAGGMSPSAWRRRQPGAANAELLPITAAAPYVAAMAST